ncbi:MAG: DUF885 domain-containing protein [Gammaproteobacteria bacterium]|nr:DUF885 domain-containing protein [Gammaproteobacteria bacterium]
MNRNLRYCLALIALFAAWSFAPLLADEADDGKAFRAIYQKEWDFRLQEFPMLATLAGHGGQAGRLGRVGEKDQVRRHRFWGDIRAELGRLSCERMDRETCIDFRIYRRQIDNFIAEYETGAYLLPFNSDWGFYMAWARLPADTQFETLEDYRNYLSRLHELPEVMDQYIALMRQGLERGITQPKIIMVGRDGPITAQIVETVEDSPFYAPFTNLPESVEAGARAALLETARNAIARDVIPAYQRLHDFFEEAYRPGARDSLGAFDLPNGERFYQAQIRRFATVDWSPQRIHDLGLSEVARIRAEMEAIIAEVGFEGDFAAFLEFLRTDPQFYAKSAKELLAFASYYAKKIDGRLPSVIGQLPRQPYGVAPVPDEIAPFYTAGRYVGAPLGAHWGGYYWVNTHALRSRPLYAIPALTLHEAAPGHHTQSALAKEQSERPPFRRFDYISAYGEGWALYAEKLGVEMGIYETPYEHFGRLTYDMWRACRLVIDTGIHARGWTREQAVDYLASNTALSLHEVNTEIDRYISWPAQALSYKLGEYTIRELRSKAEAALGDSFDLRAFHDFILSLGSVPLDVLEGEVEHWMTVAEG